MGDLADAMETEAKNSPVDLAQERWDEFLRTAETVKSFICNQSAAGTTLPGDDLAG